MPMMGALCGIYRSCVFPCVYSVYHSDSKSASCPASQPAQTKRGTFVFKGTPKKPTSIHRSRVGYWLLLP
ncbi:hypothetical protein I7I53_08450 [Histoplasma capsulatum var. duboisii H88]|uniref:Uncharacterized protein n=1 Tax=Ajellomyces capsulatus (strain H88) TaxID=544711 RepID=A0A8A1LL65_AJEC8|nr:hypothetical protein I7I53_08450 [Histoplasma capsulatum var. duboisii H88]